MFQILPKFQLICYTTINIGYTNPGCIKFFEIQQKFTPTSWEVLFEPGAFSSKTYWPIVAAIAERSSPLVRNICSLIERAAAGLKLCELSATPRCSLWISALGPNIRHRTS
jgi:hypothetical protein